METAYVARFPLPVSLYLVYPLFVWCFAFIIEPADRSILSFQPKVATHAAAKPSCSPWKTSWTGSSRCCRTRIIHMLPSSTMLVMAQHLVVPTTWASETAATPTLALKPLLATLTENQLGMAAEAHKSIVCWPARATSGAMNTKFSSKLDGTSTASKEQRNGKQPYGKNQLVILLSPGKRLDQCHLKG